MTVARRNPYYAMHDRWLTEAQGYETTAESIGSYTKHEREILKMHARAKRQCARDLMEEMSKVRRG